MVLFIIIFGTLSQKHRPYKFLHPIRVIVNVPLVVRPGRQGLNWGDLAGSRIRHLLFEIHYL